MEMPNLGEIVWYVLPSQRVVPAMVVRAHDATIVDLVVFADAEAGPEFATGTCPTARVPRWERGSEGDALTAGTWFRPEGQLAPHAPHRAV
jgi:hypothetical protein